MKNKIWLPRILSIVFILFLTLFSFDVFGTDAPLYQEIFGFFIHTLPSIALLIILILGWKKPFYTGVLYLILAIFFTVFFKTYQSTYSFILLSLLPAIIGVLFIVYKKNKRKMDKNKE